MPLKSLYVVLLIAFAAWPVSGHAGPFEDGAAGRIAVTREHVDQAKRIIRANIEMKTPAYLKAFDQIEILIVDDVKPYAYAYIDNGKRYITISTSHIILANLYAMQTFFLRNPKYFNVNKCMRLVEDSIEVMHTVSPDEGMRHPTMKPWRYCEVKGFPYSEEQIDNAFNPLFNAITTSIFGILLGHEYAHHLLGHLPAVKTTPEDSRKIENIADRSASYLLGEGGTRLPAAAMLYMLSRFKLGRDPFRASSGHAAQQCRFLFLVSHDARFRAGFSGKKLDNFLKVTPHFAGIYQGIKKQLSAGLDNFPNCVEMTYSDEQLFGVKP